MTSSHVTFWIYQGEGIDQLFYYYIIDHLHLIDQRIVSVCIPSGSICLWFYSLRAGCSIENGARSNYKGLVTSQESPLLTSYQALIIRPRAIFNGRACSQATDYTVSDLIDFYGYNRF